MLDALKINEATFISEDKFGKRFFVDFELTYNKKNTYVRTIWILKIEEEYPRLVTCYIK